MTSSENRDQGVRTADEGGSLLEARGVEIIPPEERRGTVRALGPFWFSGNAGPICAAIGLIPVALGLNLTWAIVSIVVGTAAGAALMAGHAVQGPRLGVPQMIQSRAQFGLYGAAIPVAVTLCIYVGYAILGGILAGDALASILHVSTDLGIVIANVVGFVVAVFGYHFLHRCAKIASALFVITGIAVTVALIVKVPSHSFTGGTFTFTAFLTSASICAVNMLTWSPYTSDYTRYLPADVSGSRAFWYTWAGAFSGGTWASLIGAMAGIVAVRAATANLPGYVGSLFAGISALVTLGFVLGQLLINNSANFYGSFLVVVTLVKPTGTEGMSPRTVALQRTGVAAVATAIAIGVGIAAASSIITDLTNTMTLLAAILVPWAGINLTDYYLVRHGRYAVREFFTRNGQHGLVNKRTIGIYVVTICVVLLFVNASFYEAPVAKALNGADISWIVGLLLGAVLYYVLPPRTLLRTGRRDGVAVSDAVAVSDELS
jgi:nucleobase:cation symporter-1, NCS1 family